MILEESNIDVGLGLDEDGLAREDAAGLVGQNAAREASSSLAHNFLLLRLCRHAELY